ncbi:MAG: glucose-6-phosphate dehydrogenase [Dehalococcoidia bacterium]
MSNPPTDRTTIVIFGASGDLTKRKLAPALFHLYTSGVLPEYCRFIGVARSEFSDDEFHEHLRDGVTIDSGQEDEWNRFAQKIEYYRGHSNDPESLRGLDEHIRDGQGRNGHDNRIYYLALAPSLYEDTLAALGETGQLDESTGYRRVVIEKPFGTGLQSARALNDVVHSVLDENQVYRIDHYLGKDTVQNLLVFRFANTIFEPIWNRHYVDHVQISVLEKLDIEGRGDYYDHTGVIRDMFQSHLLQLLALVAMEPPAKAGSEALRDEKAKALVSVRRHTPETAANESVRGQYIGYRDEKNVAKDSETATFGATRMFVDNWRWQGVPFFLRSGKALGRKATEIVIQFRPPPHSIFQIPEGTSLTPNALHVSIQPEEGVHLTVENKTPGARMSVRSQELEFHFAPHEIRDAYERLLLDAIQGDASLFTRSDEIELSWEIVDPFIKAWEGSAASPLIPYHPESWGPDEADALLGPDRHWMVHRRSS